MHFLLCSYYFLYANVRHGLLRSLMENYVLYGKVLKQCNILKSFKSPVSLCVFNVEAKKT